MATGIFSFYRKPSADLLLQPEQIQPIWLEETGILHFCSVSLVESPMKETHKAVLKLAKKNHAIISFDPNIRLPLWSSAEACQGNRSGISPRCGFSKTL